VTRNPLSVLLTSLPVSFEDAVAQAAELGFTHVDVVALVERPVLVSCASLGRGLPEGHGLEVASLEHRRATVDLIKRQLVDAATLGATTAYLVPSVDPSPESMARFAEGCGLLADYAASRMIQLCVEPVPGRALARADQTLDWLSSPGLERVDLLLDVGHCLISNEEPSEVVRRAGSRLGYVHIDDNDGVGDLHWHLYQGKLTRECLTRFLDALDESSYRGALALELHPELPNPVEGLRQGRDELRALQKCGE
jgi:sugar phosphate isomerase/epimerase